jgi:biopolymer transport protein ExbB/TolQ
VIVERMLKIALLGSAWVMYLMLALSVVSIGAMLERFLYFRRCSGDIDALRRALHQALADDDLFEADRVLATSPTIEARVLRPALTWLEGGAEVMSDVVASELERARKELERGSNLLGTLGNNAPFIGLLGTVIGVIEAFHQLGDAGKNQGAMGGVMAGIAEALVATAVGLFVAIPAVVAYNVAQKKIADVESNVTSLAKLMCAIVKYRERQEAEAESEAESERRAPAPYLTAHLAAHQPAHQPARQAALRHPTPRPRAEAPEITVQELDERSFAAATAAEAEG